MIFSLASVALREMRNKFCFPDLIFRTIEIVENKTRVYHADIKTRRKTEDLIENRKWQKKHAREKTTVMEKTRAMFPQQQ